MQGRVRSLLLPAVFFCNNLNMYGLTQEQMLEETKRTESENKESLAALLRIEEERKRIVIRKPPM